MDIIYDKQLIYPSDIVKFIKKLDCEFIPSISSKVDLDEYARKMLSHANIFFFKSQDHIAGLVSFYSNDLINKKGYITYFAVDPKNRGVGIGGKLLDACIAKCIKDGMLIISVKTWKSNSSGIQLYLSRGFIINNYIDDRPGDMTVILNLNLYS